MDERTVRALGAINRSFYRESAGEFDASRSAPWPGWDPLVEILDGRRLLRRLRVLDAGCGNGRFAAFLAERLGSAAAAVCFDGVDSSEALLDRAKERTLPFSHLAWHTGDFVADPGCLPDADYTLVVLFGVLHHVPGAATRRALLCQLGARLAPDGLLALTSWQFEAFARFRDKLVSFEDYNRTAAEPIDTGQLEPGDHLLPWGDAETTPVRYCHFTDDRGSERLLNDAGFETVATYTSDGRHGNLNRYLICRFRNAQKGPKEGEEAP